MRLVIIIRIGEKMKKILITGANGFVGSHFIEYILENHPQHIISAVQRAHTSGMDNVKHIKNNRVKWIECDLTDTHAVDVLFNEAPFEKIFHLAAQSFVPASYNSPTHTVDVNINGTINLLEAVRKRDPNTVIVIVSSSEVYGHQTKPPTKETEPFDPISPYAFSKCGQDLLGTMYHKIYGLNTLVTRAFTHTGARRGEVFFMSAFAKQVAKIEAGLQEPIIHVGNLESFRTIMHAKDCVKAYWMLAENGKYGEAYNIGGEELWKVGDVLEELLIQRNVPEISVVVDKTLLRPKDVNMQVPDLTKFKAVCPDWKPTHKVKNIILELLNYWRQKVHEE